MTQLGLGLDLSTKRTRKREFLDEMTRVVPWTRLIALIEPHYPTGRTGRPPFPIATMLRIHFMHVWTRRVLQAFFCDVNRSANMYPACLMGFIYMPAALMRSARPVLSNSSAFFFGRHKVQVRGTLV
jgi:hypothetical protein